MVSALHNGRPIKYITQAIVETMAHVQVVPVHKSAALAVFEKHQVHRRHIAMYDLARKLDDALGRRLLGKPLPVFI